MADYEDRYQSQLDRAAKTLVRAQRLDGGWGLRPTSVSSIVNTSEALVVLRAAGAEGPFVASGARFLIDGLPVLFRDEPRTVGGDGGRGRHLRFLTFFLDAILNYPDYAYSDEGQDRIHDCLKWFASFTEHQGGIPETVGSNLVSLHQTARVVNTTSRLSVMLRDNPSLSSPLGGLCTAVCNAATRALITAQMRSGAWPVRSGEPGASAAKTSLATVALAHKLDAVEDEQARRALQRGNQWLLANYDSWRATTSRDRLEKSTDWVHLDYAECVRGVLVSADVDATLALRKSWRFLLGLWSDEEGLWNEPAAGEGNVTIRAAYHTVMAFESARHGSRLQRPTRQHLRTGADGDRTLRTLATDNDRLVVGLGNRTFISAVGPQVLLTLDSIREAGGQASAARIASRLGVQPDSVPVYVKRLNDAISSATGGECAQAIRSRRLAGGAAEYYVDARESG